MIRTEVWFSFQGTADLLAKRRLAREIMGEDARMEESQVDQLAGTCCLVMRFPSLAAWQSAKAALRAGGGFRFKENE